MKGENYEDLRRVTNNILTEKGTKTFSPGIKENIATTAQDKPTK